MKIDRPKKILISVVICTADFNKTYPKTIKSLLKNRFKNWELIIVDQSKNKKTKELTDKLVKGVKKKLIKYSFIKDTDSGLARARNIGLKKAKGEIVSYTDDDAYVNKNWLTHIYQTFKKYKKAGIVGGKIIPVYEEKNKDWEIPEKWKYILPSYDQGNKIGNYLNGALPPGVNYSIKRKIALNLGGFNEKLGTNKKRKIQIAGEDSDMSLRILKKGLKIIYNPKVIVYHPVPLERQNIEFLRKRLFTEGLTDTYIYLLHNKISFLKKIKKLLSLFKKIICLYFNQTIQKDLKQGEISRIKGNIYGILRYWMV